MTHTERSELGRKGAQALWSLPNYRDMRIRREINARLSKTLKNAIDAMFEWISLDGKPRCLVLYQGQAFTVVTGSDDWRYYSQRYPESIIGTYDGRATIDEVMEDVRESFSYMPAVA